MNYILFDDAVRPRLLPFTHTRPVSDIRCGIMTMRERWELLLQEKTGTITEGYLQDLFPQNPGDDNLYINGAVFGTETMTLAVKKLLPGKALTANGVIVAARFNAKNMDLTTFREHIDTLPNEEYSEPVITLKNVWDIFSLNDMALKNDFLQLTKGKTSAEIPEGVTVTGKENLFIEEGAHIYAGCVINAATGPVYIAKDTEVLEGSLMRGPVAICSHGVVKMGAKIYGATTIGPGCKVGGEINNVVFFANSNKAHDGYLGNAVIGEWCNLGADTNCSNLKNNYAEVKIWDEAANKSVNTGLTFCGLLMGDHSKCGINTMFNTGTIVGVSCNLFGGDFPEKFVRSFSWGGSEGITNYDLNRAMETADRVMGRRGLKMSEKERGVYRYLYENCKK